MDVNKRMNMEESRCVGIHRRKDSNRAEGRMTLMKIIRIVANCDLERDDPWPRTAMLWFEMSSLAAVDVVPMRKELNLNESLLAEILVKPEPRGHSPWFGEKEWVLRWAADLMYLLCRSHLKYSNSYGWRQNRVIKGRCRWGMILHAHWFYFSVVWIGESKKYELQCQIDWGEGKDYR